MSIRPMPGWLLVRRFEEEKTTAGGFELPDTMQEKLTKGTIIASGDKKPVGSLATDSNGIAISAVLSLPVKVGDAVVYKKYADHPITVDGEELRLIAFENILAVIENHA